MLAGLSERERKSEFISVEGIEIKAPDCVFLPADPPLSVSPSLLILPLLTLSPFPFTLSLPL